MHTVARMWEAAVPDTLAMEKVAQEGELLCMHTSVKVGPAAVLNSDKPARKRAVQELSCCSGAGGVTYSHQAGVVSLSQQDGYAGSAGTHDVVMGGLSVPCMCVRPLC